MSAQPLAKERMCPAPAAQTGSAAPRALQMNTPEEGPYVCIWDSRTCTTGPDCPSSTPELVGACLQGSRVERGGSDVLRCVWMGPLQPAYTARTGRLARAPSCTTTTLCTQRPGVCRPHASQQRLLLSAVACPCCK